MEFFPGESALSGRHVLHNDYRIRVGLGEECIYNLLKGSEEDYGLGGYPAIPTLL